MDQFNCSLLCCRCWQWTTRSRACNSSTIGGTFSCQLWWTDERTRERTREREKEREQLSLFKEKKTRERMVMMTKKWWTYKQKSIETSRDLPWSMVKRYPPSTLFFFDHTYIHVSRWAESDVRHHSFPRTTKALALTSDKSCVTDDWLEEGHSDSISVKSPAGSSLVYQLLACYFYPLIRPPGTAIASPLCFANLHQSSSLLSLSLCRLTRSCSNQACRAVLDQLFWTKRLRQTKMRIKSNETDWLANGNGCKRRC